MSPKKKEKLQLGLKADDQSKRWEATFQQMDWWDSEKIAAAKVMVVGAGALGNEVLKNLALLNVGHILIVDFDEVEYGNLSRSILFREADCNKKKAIVAAKQIKKINSNVKVLSIEGDVSVDIGLGIFRQMDVVIGCLDNRVARLFINRHCNKVGKTWIDGAIENLGGQMDVFKPGKTCYECQLSPAELDIIEFRLGCADVAQRNANFGSIPTTPISSSIIGAMQVQEALKVIYGNDKDSMCGQRFRIYGKTNDVFFTNTLPLNQECDSHVIYDTILEDNGLSHKMSVEALLRSLRMRFDDPEAKVLLDEEIVLRIATESGPKHDVAILKYHISEEVASNFRSYKEEFLYIEETTIILDSNFPKMSVSLEDIGIPALQILKVEANQDIHFVELTGDIAILNYK